MISSITQWNGIHKNKYSFYTCYQDVRGNGVSESSEDVLDPTAQSPAPCCKFEPVPFLPNNLPPGFSDHEAIGKSGKVQLTGEEFAELKRELRERKNRLKVCVWYYN
jgi:hypothetical protein